MVTEQQGMLVFVVGLIVTLMGVGGIEHSLTAAELITAVTVAMTGLGCVWCGTVLIKRASQ